MNHQPRDPRDFERKVISDAVIGAEAFWRRRCSLTIAVGIQKKEEFIV